MENIFGVIIFILFIVLRAMGDRSKGMKKKAVPPRAKETTPVHATVKKQQAIAKTAAMPKADTVSSYSALPYMEGYERTDNTGEVQEVAGYEENEQDFVHSYGLAAGDLRQAIIWSEILENPRFRKRQVR